jgi:hypothetical protein
MKGDLGRPFIFIELPELVARYESLPKSCLDGQLADASVNLCSGLIMIWGRRITSAR